MHMLDLELPPRLMNLVAIKAQGIKHKSAVKKNDGVVVKLTVVPPPTTPPTLNMVVIATFSRVNELTAFCPLESTSFFNYSPNATQICLSRKRKYGWCIRQGERGKGS